MSSAKQQASLSIIQHHLDDHQLIDAIVQRFNKLLDETSTNKTHYFAGRFENIYPDRSRFPEMERFKHYVLELVTDSLPTKKPLQFGYWFNLMGPGHTTSLHTHEENEELLSGVCYLQAPKNSGDIVFLVAGERINIEPHVGDLLLFSPSMPHEVEENRSNQTRLSVAFNIGPRH